MAIRIIILTSCGGCEQAMSVLDGTVLDLVDGTQKAARDVVAGVDQLPGSTGMSKEVDLVEELNTTTGARTTLSAPA